MFAWLNDNKDAIDSLFKIIVAVLLVAVFVVLPLLNGTKLENTLERLGVLQDQECISDFNAAVALKAALGEERAVPDPILTELSHRCDIAVEETRIAINNLGAEMEPVRLAAAESVSIGAFGFGGADNPYQGLLPDPVVKPVVQPEPDRQTGFVAIGRVEPGSFSDVNFDVLAGQDWVTAIGPDSAGLAEGAILRARWSVNLRENTLVTTGGENDKIGLVAEGQCVEIVDISPASDAAAPEVVRGQYWAEVTIVPCPVRGGG